MLRSVLVAMTVTVGSAWAVSGVASFGVRGQKVNQASEVGIQSGCLVISHIDFPGIAPEPWRPVVRWSGRPRWEWWAGREQGLHVDARRYPLWWAVVLLAAPTLWVVGRRWGAGRCGRCGYDRAGLGVEAACPECGAKGQG